MILDPRSQGDARTNTHAVLCGGYSRKMTDERCKEGCECWCHFNFRHTDGSEREDAEALRALHRSLSLKSKILLDMKRSGRMN